MNDLRILTWVARSGLSRWAHCNHNSPNEENTGVQKEGRTDQRPKKRIDAMLQSLKTEKGATR